MPVSSDMNIALFFPPFESAMKKIEETLILDSKWNHFVLRNQDYARSISTVAFQHFINCSTETVAHPAIRDVMKTDMIRVSFSVSRSGFLSLPNQFFSNGSISRVLT